MTSNLRFAQGQLTGALAAMQNLKDKIHSHYRVRLILDNLPVTTNDLDEESAELMRPGFDIGSEDSGNFYVNNHLMFKILVHKTNGQYTRARQEMNIAEIEAAAEAEVGTVAVTWTGDNSKSHARNIQQILPDQHMRMDSCSP